MANYFRKYENYNYTIFFILDLFVCLFSFLAYNYYYLLLSLLFISLL
jgi:hypothetical protein